MKRIALLIALSGIINSIQACSVCGCSASNQYLGILPQSKNSFVGLQYQYREFDSKHAPSVNEGAENTSRDFYHTTQLWGRFNIAKKRIQIFAFVPFVFNERTENSVYSKNSGLGDITILSNYRLLSTKNTTAKFKHNMLIGGGVKLPTGKYDSDAIKHGEGLPNMQPGTASFDFIANSNYTIQTKKNGVNTELSYTLTTVNKNEYKFGNRISTGITLFRIMRLNNNNFIPQLGIRYDINSLDYSNYYWSVKNKYSGGQVLYSTAGLQYFYRNIGGQVRLSLPISQNYSDGMVYNKYKAEAGMYFLF